MGPPLATYTTQPLYLGEGAGPAQKLDLLAVGHTGSGVRI
jgi:hypothetical protein